MFTERRGGGRGEQGQATTETLVSMLFLMLFLWGTVHMAMFAISKTVVSYAAFYAARTAMVNGGSVSLFSPADIAGRLAMRNWQLETLWAMELKDRTSRGVTRRTVRAIATVPFGAPIFSMWIPAVFVYGNAPTVTDSVAESGDNK